MSGPRTTAHDERTPFLGNPALADTVEPDDPTEALETDAGRLRASLGRRYSVRRLLGRGGMGEVYEAYDHALRKPVAIKYLREDLRDPELEESLRAEVALAQRVTHRNVCRTYDMEALGGDVAIKMEYVDGVTLGQRVGLRGPLSVAATVRPAREVTAGLEAAHAAGIVHCDLKPSNIVVEARTRRVVLMDFGVARAAGPLGCRSVGGGTPGYAAPEQCRGEPVDGRADLYALGCVLHFALVGAPPEPDATSVRDRRRDVPPWLDRMIRRLLERDPDKRFQRADAVADVLRRARRRARLPAVVFAATGAVALGVAAWSSLGRGPVRQRWTPAIEEVSSTAGGTGTPAVSPDGERIAWASDRDGTDRIYVQSRDGSLPRPVGPGMHVRWARDGTHLLSITIEWELVRFPVDGGEPEHLAYDVIGFDDCGDVIAMVQGRRDCQSCLAVATLARDGTVRRSRELPPAARARDVSCAPEGDAFAFSMAIDSAVSPELEPEWDLWRAPLDGGQLVRLTNDGKRNRYPAYSPDGSWLYFSSARAGLPTVWAMPARGGKPVRITPGPGPERVGGITADGKNLVYATDTRVAQFVAYSIDGKHRRRIDLPFDGIDDYTPTRDGKEIVLIGGRGGQLVVAVLDLASGRVDELVELAHGGSAAPTLDGSAVVVGDGSTLSIVSRADGARRHLADMRGPIRRVEVDASGARVWTHEDGGPQVTEVSLTDGAMTRLDTGNRTLSQAPEGNWRLLVQPYGPKAEDGLYAPGAPLDGPPTRSLRPHSAVTWQQDGSALLYWDGREIVRHQVVDGVETTLFSANDVDDLEVSPDGKTVYVSQPVRRTRRFAVTNLDAR